MKRKKIVLMGAAGRDFHNFNTLFRNNQKFEVVAFTAAQIPNIEKRVYPPILTGNLYPNGIKIYPEKDLKKLIKQHKISEVIFSYSDISHEHIMNKACLVNAAGADFRLLEAEQTMLKSEKPMISVCAVRTGCGKSQTARRVCKILKEEGKKVVVIRHPMPYGDLEKQICQRFENIEDLKKHKCTIEEMEEYQPLIENDTIVFAGVDYEKILKEAEKEAEVIVFDGGNNDTPFFKPNLEIVVLDPHRPGHELKYYPGEINLRRADVTIINKVDSAKKSDVKTVENNIKMANPTAKIIKAESEIIVENPAMIKNKKVVCIEDGPTLTHGGMAYGAGLIAAKKYKSKIVKPESYAVGSIKQTFEKYPHLTNVLPAMGYSKKQIKELEETINNIPCDLVLSATPINLENVIKVNKPIIRVSYELKEEKGILKDLLKEFLSTL